MKFGRVHHGSRLFCRVDVGNDDALRAHVEGAINDARVVLIDPHHRRHTPQVARPAQVRNVREVHRAVLPLDPYRIESEWPQEINHMS